MAGRRWVYYHAQRIACICAGEVTMTTTLWLRISSVIALLFAAGHTLGGLRHWSPMGENPVLQAMRETRFQTMGVTRSYLDFYTGFGYSLSVSGLMLAVLLWQLATVARKDATMVRPMIAVIALATLVSGIIAWQLIFPLPALFSLVLFASLTAAFAVAR
jgi:hypothetical protein